MISACPTHFKRHCSKPKRPPPIPEQKSIKVKIPNQSFLTHNKNTPYLRERQTQNMKKLKFNEKQNDSKNKPP
ncbi:hypothetical protein CGC32_01920 [Helicobacter pylori]|nr:hypothetical protein CGC32_01920 [Helicobacter pylori]